MFYMSETTKLWRRVEDIQPGSIRNGKRQPSHLVYTWVLERECLVSTAADWLVVFQKAEPDQVFQLNPSKPRCTRITKP
jgi:hypothetical protein